MKKWIPVLAVVLGASVGLAAPTEKLSCTNEFQETLEIVSDVGASTLTALLTSNGVTQSFDGAILSTGKFDMNPSKANENVSLAVVQPRDHGGRCGRCAVGGISLDLYAQLIVGPSGYIFKCQQNGF
jgi:hypothetical protein